MKYRLRLPDREQTLNEEIANSVTHGLGAGLSVAALSILVTLAGLEGDPWRIVSFSIFGTALILLYLASTLYHAFQNPRVKRFFNMMDHSMIFILIAGSYTPFTLVTLRGAWGWTLFGLIWGFALAGVTFKIIFKRRFMMVSVGFYLAMGWLVVIAMKPLIDALPPWGLGWLAIGGACYTLGVVFYIFDRLPYWHTIWHLFVLGGSFSHFFAVLWFV